MHKRGTTILVSAIYLALGWSLSFSQTRNNVSEARQPEGGAETTSGNTGLTPSAGREVMELKEQIALQQKQIQQLRVALEKQEQLLERLIQSTQAQPTRAAANTSNLGEIASIAPVIPSAAGRPIAVRADSLPIPNTPATGPSTSIGLAQNPAEAGEKKPLSPLTLRIGDADFTVGGFVDATAFFRSTNLGSGIGTSFGSLPFSNTPAGRLTETRFSAQNSRVSLMATSKVGASNVKGYLEADFLGFQPTNAFVTSNSNSMRMRLYWVQLIRDKFEIFGGQSWSMLNPGRTGISPMPSDIFFSQNMDTNYQVGLTWSRNQQFRFIYHPNKEWAAGVSLENPQQFVGQVTLPSTFPAGEVDQGANTAAPNLHPDIIGKVTWDPMFGGKHMHVEVAGLLSSFRLFNPATNTKSSATGGGGSVNFNLEAAKNLHLMLNTFYSDGGGRWIFGLGPDFIVKADGTPSLVHASSGIAGFEYQFNPKTMAYGYYGGAYFQRNTSIVVGTGGAQTIIGFGPGTGNSLNQNKSVQEGTFGIIQTFWKNPRYGALQLITQYSYLTREPWSVPPGNPKDAHLSMSYVNLRYVLP